jgi:hypothetical protein
MDEHDIEMVGEYCQSVLDHPLFRMLCNQFELSCVQRIQNTSPKQIEAREEAYHTFQSAREFLDFLNSFVEQKDAIARERDTNKQAAIDAGLSPDMPPDEDVLLGDDLRFE